MERGEANRGASAEKGRMRWMRKLVSEEVRTRQDGKGKEDRM